MKTNIEKKQIDKLNIGLDMLADRQQEYIKSIGEIALVLHSNALEQDTLTQPSNPEYANSLLHDIMYFLSALDVKACKYLQNKLCTETEADDYKTKYEQLLEQNVKLQQDFLAYKEINSN